MTEVDITTKLRVFTCCSCGGPIALTEMQEIQLRESHKTFYCPNGHSQWFPAESEAEKLRKKLHDAELEKTRLTQRVEAQAEESRRLAAQVEAQAKAAARVKKRAAAGVCPCCNRTFSQLARHMKTKHPEAA